MIRIQRLIKEARAYILNEESDVYKDLVNITKNLGYDNIKKKSGFRFFVLTDDNRLSVMNTLESAIKQKYPEAKWDENAGTSSLGAIVYGKYQVGVSPASKQGSASAGLKNEHTLFNMIGEITKSGPINIVFKSGSNEFRVENVIGYTDAGRDTAGGKKADIILNTQDKKKIPISIKKDNAEMWESADRYYSSKAKSIIDELVEKEEVALKPHKNVYRISPNIAVKADKNEIRRVVFGTDILKKGAVVERTFKGNYSYENGEAVIKVSKIITSVNDLKGNYEIYFLIRNDSSRRGSKIYPGVRVLAVKKTRINKNVKVVKG